MFNFDFMVAICVWEILFCIDFDVPEACLRIEQGEWKLVNVIYLNFDCGKKLKFKTTSIIIVLVIEWTANGVILSPVDKPLMF